MKKLFTIKLIAVAVIAVVLASCSKYEEGSKFTVMTKKMRVVGEWDLKSVTYTIDGASVTDNVTGITVSIKKDNTFTYTYSSQGFSFTETGIWDFSSDKEQLIMTDSDGDVSTSTIVMLKNKELKLKDVDGSDEVIYDYQAK